MLAHVDSDKTTASNHLDRLASLISTSKFIVIDVCPFNPGQNFGPITPFVPYGILASSFAATL